MKHAELRACAHNVADSLASGIGLMIGHYDMDVFGEAMVGLSKSDEAFRPYFLVGKPTEAKLEGAFERAVAFLGEAPGPHQPTVIREDEIERFVSDLEKEMIVHNART